MNKIRDKIERQNRLLILQNLLQLKGVIIIFDLIQLLCTRILVSQPHNYAGHFYMQTLVFSYCRNV